MIHSSTPSFLIAYQRTWRGTLSKAFSRLTKAKYRFLFFAKKFSCNCLEMNIASEVPRPCINPNYISSSFVIFLICFQQIIPKIINNERNHIKGTSSSSGTTDIEPFVTIVNSCQPFVTHRSSSRCCLTPRSVSTLNVLYCLFYLIWFSTKIWKQWYL